DQNPGDARPNHPDKVGTLCTKDAVTPRSIERQRSDAQTKLSLSAIAPKPASNGTFSIYATVANHSPWDLRIGQSKGCGMNDAFEVTGDVTLEMTEFCLFAGGFSFDVPAGGERTFELSARVRKGFHRGPRAHFTLTLGGAGMKPLVSAPVELS